MKYILHGIFWIGLYLLLVLAPLFVLILAPAPPGNGFVHDLSMALGFAGAAMMAVMFVLTARFKRATAPFGIDLIYYFHRQIALVALLFVVAHPVLLLMNDPGLWPYLHPAVSPLYLDAGVGSLLALLALVGASLWRKRFGIHYDGWRLWHVILAIVSLPLAIYHIRGFGYYVNMPWKHGLWTLIPLSCLLIVLYVRLLKPAQLRRHPYRVTAVQQERGDAWTLTLRPDGHAGFTFEPGQFAWLTLWHSPFALKEHPFSIASSAEESPQIRFTIKELGDFTRRIGTVQPDQLAYVDAPYGAFSIDRLQAPGYVFIAGGIGIVPIVSMLRTLADRRDRRPLLLFYGYSSWERLTLREDLEALQQRLDLKVVYVLGEPHAGWTGETGMLTTDLLARHLPPEKTELEYLICGPVPMIHAVERSLSVCGISLMRIHSELFDLV